MSEAISLKRIYLLLRRVLPDMQMMMLIILLIPFILLLLHGFRHHPSAQEQELVQGMFASLLILGGCLFASMAFTEMQDKQYNFAWFMLPASILEKFIAQLLLSTVLYIVFLIIAYFLVTLAADFLSQLLFGNRLALFQPFDAHTGVLIGRYFLFHSIFFLGAAFFRKRIIIKTLATLFFLFFLLILIIGFTIYWYYPECRATGSCLPFTFDLQTYSMYQHTLRWTLYVMLPLLLWFVAYKRVRKTDISHGV